MTRAKKNVQTAEAYDVPLFKDGDYLPLNFNESDWGPSPRVIDALRNIEAKDLQYYPFYGELVHKLAEVNGVNPENIITTAGADEAINVVLNTFLEEGQTILIVTPTYDMPKIYSKVSGLNFVEVPYKERWEFPIEEFLKEIPNADLIYITTPNSPTGELLNREYLERIIEASYDKLLLIDETYINFTGKNNVDKLWDNVFITRSFSKDYGLAGLRLGYVISSAENIDEIRKFINPYSVSSLTAIAGVAALKDSEYFNAVKTEMKQSKEIMAKGLSDLGATVYPSDTNFLCVDFGDKCDFVYKKLLENNIKIKYIKNEPLLKNCFRITIPRLSNARKFLESLKIKPTILFDMDGVLINTINSYRVCILKTYNHFTGQEITQDDIKRVKMLGGYNNDWDLLTYLFNENGFKVKYDDIIEYFQNLYWDGEKGVINDETPIITKEILEELKKDYNLAIFTGRPMAEAMYTLKKEGFENYFYPIITLETVGLDHQKPDTKGVEEAKKRLITSEIYYLGDTVDDMICAKNAKVQGIGVLPPQDKSEILKNRMLEVGATAVISDTKEILEYLTKQTVKGTL